MDLRRDMIISGSYWPEPVRVRSAVDLGDEIQLEAVGTRTGQAYEELLPRTALAQIIEHRLGGESDARALRLALEAQRIRLAYTYDPHFAVSVSQIDPLPHQLEAVYHHLLQLPQIRFLLADDPGAGKTIMAGLLLKELKLRAGIERILVVAPAKLTRQWARELRDKSTNSST